MGKSPIIRRSSVKQVVCTPLVVSCRLGLVVVLLLIVSIADSQLNGHGPGHNFAEARYLPTRSDDSGVEVLKEIIKNVSCQHKQQYRANAKHAFAYYADRSVRTPISADYSLELAQMQ